MLPLMLIAGVLAAAPAATTVPFVYDDTRLWVTVTVPGRDQAPMSFVLDDGVSDTFVDAQVAKKFGWKVSGEHETPGVGGGRTHVGVADSSELRVGGVPTGRRSCGPRRSRSCSRRPAAGMSTESSARCSSTSMSWSSTSSAG
jgi:hypothetical protein